MLYLFPGVSALMGNTVVNLSVVEGEAPSIEVQNEQGEIIELPDVYGRKKLRNR